MNAAIQHFSFNNLSNGGAQATHGVLSSRTVGVGRGRGRVTGETRVALFRRVNKTGGVPHSLCYGPVVFVVVVVPVACRRYAAIVRPRPTPTFGP